MISMERYRLVDNLSALLSLCSVQLQFKHLQATVGGLTDMLQRNKYSRSLVTKVFINQDDHHLSVSLAGSVVYHTVFKSTIPVY